MSRWLSGVNNLLEKLDDRVETVAEERAALAFENDDDDDAFDVKEGDESGSKITALESILARRGLSSVDSQDDEETGEEKGNSGEHSEESTQEMGEILEAANKATTDPATLLDMEAVDSGPVSEAPSPKQSAANASKIKSSETSQEGKGSGVGTNPQSTIIVDQEKTDAGKMSKNKKDAVPAATQPSKNSKQQSTTNPQKLSTPTRNSETTRPSAATPTRVQTERNLTLEMKEALKETRTLRRHVVALNEQLEAAENELKAQRKELERAAERMEKDRIRTKQEKEATQKRQAQEASVLKEQNEKSLREQHARFEAQLEGYRKRLLEEENKRKQEGGDWNKEMKEAIDREQEMRVAVTALEDEKAVLLTRISTLEGQQNALGSRLESLTQAADNATEREREAEDRLDSLLNQHARQISQRQAREAELEQTIQELNAALVACRKNGGVVGMVPNSVGLNENISSDARIRGLQMELETANSHLVLERERIETLQMQLRDLSKETTLEATTVHQKQLQAERLIADMSLTISKLEARLHEAEKGSTKEQTNVEQSYQEAEMTNQIQMLSEEIVRLRDKLAGNSSESLATRNRLKAALERVSKLEDELSLARTPQSNGNDIYDSMERAQTSRRRRPGASANVSSIRSAMRLDATGGERSKQIGQAIDVVDSFAVTTGKYLRRNPLARAGFIFYLIMIHLWSFVILFFHAHSFEEHGDFGAGVGVPHGPHALMMDTKLAKPLNVENADASRAIPLPKGGSFSKPDALKEEDSKEIMGENDTGKDSTVGSPANVGDVGKSATGNDGVGKKDARDGQ